jgi:hypothetical protein
MPSGNALILDSIPQGEIVKTIVSGILVTELILFVISITLIVIWWDTGYVWILFAKVLLFPRIVCLIILLFRKVNVLRLLGTKKYSKIIRYLSYYPELGIWFVIGLISGYFLWVLVLIADLIGLILTGRFISFQALFYLTLDVAAIVEVFVSIYYIYYEGVFNNIVHTYKSNSNKATVKRKKRKSNKTILPL